jgi:hypothetical protein
MLVSGPWLDGVGPGCCLRSAALGNTPRASHMQPHEGPHGNVPPEVVGNQAVCPWESKQVSGHMSPMLEHRQQLEDRDLTRHSHVVRSEDITLSGCLTPKPCRGHQ